MFNNFKKEVICGKISVVHKNKLFFNLKVILIISIYKSKRVTVLIMFLRLSNYLLCCTLDVWKLGYLKTYHKIVIKNIYFSVNYQTKNSFKIKVDYKICSALLFCLRNRIQVYRSSADIFDLNLIMCLQDNLQVHVCCINCSLKIYICRYIYQPQS